MTDTSVATINPAPAPVLTDRISESGRQLKVTGKVRAALDAMVWDGLNRRDAAQHAGLAEHSLYVAFRKPHIKAYYLAQLEVLRTSERARNIHTLAEVRDQQSNQMARVQAVKALEQISDDPEQQRGLQRAPGLTVVIQTAPLIAHQTDVSAKPLIEQQAVRIGDDERGD